MPDNKNLGSNELVERGWQQMSDLLDKEMPQRERRRGVAWIWWGIGALVILAGLLVLLPKAGEQDVKPAENIPAQQHTAEQSPAGADDPGIPSISDTAKTQEAIAATGQTQVPDAGSIGISSPEKRKESTAEESSLPESLVLTGTNDRQDRSQESTGKTETSIIASADTERTATTDQAGTEARSTSSDSPDQVREQDSEVMTDLATQDSQDVPRVSGQMRAQFLLPDLEGPGSESLQADARSLPSWTELKDPFRRKVALHGMVAGHFDDAIQMYGAETGLALTVDIGRRLNLLTGLTYGHYREMGIWRISANKQADEFAAPITDVDTMQGGSAGPGTFILANEIYANTVNYDTARILADRYNYLHLPLVLQYQLTPGLKISMGVRGSRLLSAPSEYAISDQSGSFNQNVQLNARGANNFLYNYDILRKWDVAPLVGLGIATGRRMSIDVRYQLGLIPFVDRTGIVDRSDYHRSLSVGLQYRIW